LIDIGIHRELFTSQFKRRCEIESADITFEATNCSICRLPLSTRIHSDSVSTVRRSFFEDQSLQSQFGEAIPKSPILWVGMISSLADPCNGRPILPFCRLPVSFICNRMPRPARPLESPDFFFEQLFSRIFGRWTQTERQRNSLIFARFSHFDPQIIRRFRDITAPDD
jgi:hypothetical protein